MGVGDGMLRFNGIGERVTWGLYNNDTPTEVPEGRVLSGRHWARRARHGPDGALEQRQVVHHLLDVFQRVDRELRSAPALVGRASA